MRKVFLVCCFALSAMFAAAQTTIQVQTHNVVREDEQFTVAFIIEGSRPSDFSWNPGEDFELLWGPQQGRSSSVQIINGKRTESSQTTYSYVLMPVKPGKFMLPKADATVNGKKIYSSDVAVEVLSIAESVGSKSADNSSRQQSASAQSSRQQSPVSAQDIFLVLSLNRTSVVVGEPLKAKLKLYQKVDVAGFEGADFPDFDGFWSQETYSPQQIQFEREAYDGQIYNSALLREYVLIPQHAGNITIAPAELTCLVNVRISSGGSSIFDGFFDDYTRVRKKVTSRPVSVNVKPLPPGAPASFAGGVGRYRISASLSIDSLMTHDAASLVLKVTGEGNISLLETPKVKFPLDMETYDPKVVSSIAENGLSGTKTYEYPFIPRSAGDFVFEPIEYTYYDIDQHKYVTLTTPALPLRVERGAETEVSGPMIPGGSPKGVRDLDKDIRYINMKPQDFQQKGAFLLGSGPFWALLTMLVAAAMIVFAVVRRTMSRRADVVGMKNRKASKMAQKRLRNANALLKKNARLEFYAELHKAMLGYMSDKLNMPAADLSKDKMSQALMDHGVSQEDIKDFMGILDSCEYARYSPDAGNNAMNSEYDKAVEVISSIDSCMKNAKVGSVRGIAVLMLLLSLPAAVSAADMDRADSLWNAANQAYAGGEWAEAVADYEEISQMGLESAALYCNMGDAWCKSGDVARAVLYYERALRLDPSYSDAAFNLGLMQERIQDRIEPVPEFFLKEWMRDICYVMSSDAWAVLFLVLAGVSLALMLVFMLARSVVWRRVGFFTGLVTLLLMFSALGFSSWQKTDYASAGGAIVMKTVTSVKSSPMEGNSTDLFILHEGTRVNVLDAADGWVNVSLADGRQGWMKSTDIEMI